MRTGLQQILFDRFQYLFQYRGLYKVPFSTREKIVWHWNQLIKMTKYWLNIPRYIRNWKFLEDCKRRNIKGRCWKERWQKPSRPKYPINLGIECDDGWFNLIRKLCYHVEALDPERRVRIFQIKEKLGGLRFYIENGNEEIDKIINQLENKSYEICEICGDPGELCQSGWLLKTVCKKHRKWTNASGFQHKFVPQPELIKTISKQPVWAKK